MMQRYLNWLLMTVLCVFLVACSNPNSPKGIAKSFWKGIQAQDEVMTRKYTTAATQDAINFAENQIDWSKMQVKLGATDMADDTAVVHTEIQDSATGLKYAFRTYLVKENGAWRVDYVRTRKASITSEIFANIADGLQKFNKSLNESFDDTVEGFKEASPDIQKQLEALSDTIDKKSASLTTEQQSSIRQRLDDFKQAMTHLFEPAAKKEEAATPAAA